jgi:hypothetical protein
MSDELDDQVREKLEEANIAISECKDCGEDIIFLKTKKDKWMPLDMNLEPHWAKCPGATKFRRG